MIKNFRNLLALVYLAVLLIWLAVVCFVLLPTVMAMPEGLDPMLSMVAGLGVGGITQFFILIGTLIFQFYFRKTQEGEKPAS